MRHGLFILACVLLATALGGCAAGRGPGGEVIVGLDIAKLPETTGQILNAAAGFLPAPFNYLATLGGGLLLAGGSAATARASAKRDAEAQRARENAAWDEAHARATGGGPPAAGGPVPPEAAPGVSP